MDPISHVVVNSAFYSAVSQDSISLDNPTFLATTIGSLIPDGDGILQIFGDIPYLKHHRGASHSILGAIILSALTALPLSLLFSYNYLSLFGFTLLGVGSHLFLDWCNSYGIKLLWPISPKMYSCNLLILIEPILILLSITSILGFSYDYFFLAWGSIAFMGVYLISRYLSRINFGNYLFSYFQDKNINKMVVLPASKSFFHWDFIVETDYIVYVGQAPIFRRAVRIKEKLSKRIEEEIENSLINKALNSKIGKLFQEFTPHYLVKHHKTSDNKHLITFIDLRYHIGERFLHHATVKCHNQGMIEEELFQPYHPNRKVYME
ncbi:metal-dependent hydrolase [Natranaerobius trueperi]|nr:metal-dependent hydrolase [Natranaerobius trueperi]